ncbi:hypothetical protein [Allokutzneria albata]|uniref:ABC-2 family transporter protein n=1 Tax=Allokutzneria albata TaxID=211114 RepID=A0A1H0ASH8_ALLAB|nr:hypothetical protein [Allokutzneria albata]SDN36043.1 hypothetical protein SAMN04489726_6231 [Allokutzneria albata]
MTWLVWRQHRWVIVGITAAFVALSSVFLIAGTTGNGSILVWGGTVIGGFPGFLRSFEEVNNGFAPLPLLVGVLAGAPLLAGELEHGTHRYSWTQGVSRNRWLTTTTSMTGAAVAVLSATYAAVHTWWYGPYAAQGGWFMIASQGSLALPAACVFTFALGTASGALLGRVVPAMATVVIGHLAVLVVERTLVRRHHLLGASPDFWTYQAIQLGLYAGLAACCFAVSFLAVRNKFS